MYYLEFYLPYPTVEQFVSCSVWKMVFKTILSFVWACVQLNYYWTVFRILHFWAVSVVRGVAWRASYSIVIIIVLVVE